MKQTNKLIYRFLIVCFLCIVVFVSAPDSNRYDYFIPYPRLKIIIPLQDTTITRIEGFEVSEDSVVTSVSMDLEDKDFYSLLDYIDPLKKIMVSDIIVYLNYDIKSNSVIILDSIKGISYFKFKGDDTFHYCYTGQKEALHFNKELSAKVDRMWIVDIDTLATKIISSPRISHIQIRANTYISSFTDKEIGKYGDEPATGTEN